MKSFARIVAILVLVACLPTTGAIIKVGDVLDIQVQGHPEFSGYFAVNAQGMIDYTLLADENLVNITTAELMRDITLSLAKIVDNPMVMIKITDKPPISITVLGEIVKPGPIATYQGVSMQEVLLLGGGPTKSANTEKIKIIHKGLSEESAEYFNLKQFLQNGNTTVLPHLGNNDIVVLLTQERAQSVKVIGAVQRPGFFELQEKMTVFELIYLAGGPAEKADLARVRRFSNQNGKTIEEILDIQAYIDKGEMDAIPMVATGDVVIVYSKWFDWKTLLDILNNTLLFIVAIQTFGGLFK